MKEKRTETLAICETAVKDISKEERISVSFFCLLTVCLGHHHHAIMVQFWST